MGERVLLIDAGRYEGIGFEPVFLEMMRLQPGSFGDDEEEVAEFLAEPS